MKLPKLMYYSTVLPASCYHIYSVETNGLTEPEATEVIRRAEVYGGLVEAIGKLKLRERADDIWAFQKEGNLSYDQRISIKRFSGLLHSAAKTAEQALAGE